MMAVLDAPQTETNKDAVFKDPFTRLLDLTLGWGEYVEKDEAEHPTALEAQTSTTPTSPSLRLPSRIGTPPPKFRRWPRVILLTRGFCPCCLAKPNRNALS